VSLELYDLAGDGEVVVDSWRIALHLERKYASSLLMDGAHARGAILALKNWLERAVHPAVLKVIVLDLYAHLHEKDKRYFRESREKRFGMALEAFAADGSAALLALRQALDPVRPVLAEQRFLGGGARIPGLGLVSSRSRPTGRTAVSSIPRSRSAPC